MEQSVLETKKELVDKGEVTHSKITSIWGRN